MQEIGFVGLGAMGSIMAPIPARAGFQVQGAAPVLDRGGHADGQAKGLGSGRHVRAGGDRHVSGCSFASGYKTN